MALFGFGKKSEIPDSADALPGRAAVMKVPERHFVNGNSMAGPFPEHLQQAMFGLGCFWGAERKFWTVQGVYSTAVGYAGGFTPNATYDEVCSGGTGHNEVVLVIFDPAMCSYDQLLTVFWEAHNPTQGMRQGNDAGTQYRSGIYAFTAEQQMAAERSLARYQPELTKLGLPDITTEVITAPEFYYAEEYHQQYLAKNPAGYCGIGGTGACLPPEQ